MSILGKRYPANEEEFATSSLAAQGEVFDPSQASKRMKIPTPVTWETEISANGNNAAVWENLIRTKKLPYMAMLRNLANLVKSGVTDETHANVANRICHPEAVTNSRQFPFRYLTAYAKMKELAKMLPMLQKLHDDPNFVPPEPPKRGGRGRRG
jgi:telomerase protein component 1